MVTAALEPGVHPGLTRADLPPGLSYSGAKDILRSPAHYQWRRANPQPATAAMEQGTIAHALTLGTPQTWRTIAGGAGVTARRDAARADGLVPTTLPELAEAARMAAAIWGTPVAGDLLVACSMANRETAVVAQDPDTGVMVRGFLDALHDGGRYAVDIKTGRDGTLDDFGRTAVNLGYDLQAAAYQTALEWLGRPVDAFLFLVVESAPPYRVGVRELDGEFLTRGRLLLRRALQLYADCTATGIWPGPPVYQLVSAPRWALAQEGIA